MRLVRFLSLVMCVAALAAPAFAGDYDFKAPAPPPPPPAPAKKAPAHPKRVVKHAPKPAAKPDATVASASPVVVVTVVHPKAEAPAAVEPAHAPEASKPAPAPVAAAAPAKAPAAVAVEAPPAPVKAPATVAVEAPPAPAKAPEAPVAAAPAAPAAPAKPAGDLVAVVTVPPPAATPAAAAATTPNTALTLPGLGGKSATGAPPQMVWNGSMRFRYEARNVLDYRMPGALKRPATQRLDEAGDVSLMRLRIGGNVKFSPLVRGEFVVQDARVMGVEGSPSTAIANVDLYYAYVDVDSLGAKPLAVRVGRQLLEYGDGYLIMPSNWGNPGRAWDGVRARYAPKGWQVDGFATWVMEGRVEGSDRLFSGADALWKGVPGLDVEGYAFARSYGDTSFTSERGGPKRSLRDLSTGLRARWKKGGAELRAEGVTQSGDRGGDRVQASSATARAAWEIKHPKKPKLAAEIVWASGDGNAADGVAKRYDPLFWNSHGPQGAMDIFGRANAFCLSASGSVQAGRTVNVQLDVHRFRLVDARDAWYDDAGTALRRDATGRAGRDVGAEGDLAVRWDARPGVGLLLGASHFVPGSFVKATGGAPAQDWGYVQMTVSF